MSAGNNTRIRIAGVGGTGIVTIAQILATAAAIEGKYVRSLDQTGLAQKGGAVVSDLKISTQPVLQAGKLSAESCDLYLVCDPLVGTDPANLSVASDKRTVAVVSSTEIPTGQMIVDTSAVFPEFTSTRSAIEHRSVRAVTLEAGQLARELFGDEQFSNMLMVGAAFQTGQLPMSADAIELAIELNGVAVERNHQAFRRGRQVVIDPNLLHADASQPPDSVQHSAQSGDVNAIIDLRAADLTCYQGPRYARRYRDEIAQVMDAERRVAPGSTVLTEAAARFLYKLMAYKDEYEVARLALDPAFKATVTQQFGSSSKAYVRLHPPLLRAIGLKHKISLGRWFEPAFRILYGMRRLRGTMWDPFGHTHIRRLERDLIEEYILTLRTLTAELNASNLAAAVAIAELPDIVRGYENIKAANVEHYRQQLSTLRKDFDAATAVS